MLHAPGIILSTGDAAVNQTDKCWQHIQIWGKYHMGFVPPYPLILQPVAKTCKIRSFYFKEMEREARVVENWRKKTVDDDGQNAKG